MNLATFRATLETVVGQASAAELPTILGEFERAKAMAWAKLTPTQNGAQVQGEYLTVREVVGRLRLSRARVYELIRSGDLPHVRMGRRGMRIRLSDLTQWEKRPKFPIDKDINTLLNHLRDRRRPTAAAHANEAHPGAARPAPRGALGNRQSVGAGQGPDP